MVALAIALLPFAIGSMGSAWEWAGWVSITSVGVMVFLVGYFISVVVKVFSGS